MHGRKNAAGPVPATGSGRTGRGFARLALLGVAMLLATPAASASADPIIRDVVVGDRTVTITWNRVPGDTLTPVEREEIPGVAFGRYRVWRSESPDPESFALLRSYSLFNASWGSFARDTLRIFCDPDSVLPTGINVRRDDTYVGIPGPFNGFTYYYAVTWEDAYYDSASGVGVPAFIPRLGIEEGMHPHPVFPGREARQENPLLAAVSVVPNPYNPGGFAGQQAFPGPPRVQFLNLPSRCTISIYTVDGGLVRVLEHDSDLGARDWDLRNDDGRDVAAGIYVYHVRAGDQETLGRLVVIR